STSAPAGRSHPYAITVTGWPRWRRPSTSSERIRSIPPTGPMWWATIVTSQALAVEPPGLWESVAASVCTCPLILLREALERAEEPFTQGHGRIVAHEALVTGATELGAQCRGAEQWFERVREILRFARSREDARSPILDEVAWPAGVHRDDRHARGHPLEQHDPERLGVRRVDQNVELLDVAGCVRHLAGHRHGVLEPEARDRRRQRRGVLRRELVGVAADDHEVKRMPALAQQRLGPKEPVLSLPRLQAAHDPDDGKARRQLEGSVGAPL